MLIQLSQLDWRGVYSFSHSMQALSDTQGDGEVTLHARILPPSMLKKKQGNSDEVLGTLWDPRLISLCILGSNPVLPPKTQLLTLMRRH